MDKREELHNLIEQARAVAAHLQRQASDAWKDYVKGKISREEADEAWRLAKEAGQAMRELEGEFNALPEAIEANRQAQEAREVANVKTRAWERAVGIGRLDDLDEWLSKREGS